MKKTLETREGEIKEKKKLLNKVKLEDQEMLKRKRFSMAPGFKGS